MCEVSSLILLQHCILAKLQAGTRASPSTMVPSVKILGIIVCFGVRNEAKMLPSFLRCFPNVETLHVEVRHSLLDLAFIYYLVTSII